MKGKTTMDNTKQVDLESRPEMETNDQDRAMSHLSEFLDKEVERIASGLDFAELTAEELLDRWQSSSSIIETLQREIFDWAADLYPSIQNCPDLTREMAKRLYDALLIARYAFADNFTAEGEVLNLSDHPKPANGYHLKTGQRE